MNYKLQLALTKGKKIKTTNFKCSSVLFVQSPIPCKSCHDQYYNGLDTSEELKNKINKNKTIELKPINF